MLWCILCLSTQSSNNYLFRLKTDVEMLKVQLHSFFLSCGLKWEKMAEKLRNKRKFLLENTPPQSIIKKYIIRRPLEMLITVFLMCQYLQGMKKICTFALSCGGKCI